MYLCLALVLLAACSPALVPNRGIKEVLVTATPATGKGRIVSITDGRTIASLVDQINCSREDPAVFYSTYSVRLKSTAHGEILILINGKRLKINGITFINDQNIETMLAQSFKK